MLVLDDLKNPGTSLQGHKWKFFTDGVMGGKSSGRTRIEEYKDKKCYRMTGNVTTENNGGFIQMRITIDPLISSSDYEGIYISAFGNNHKYSIHIRTPFTLAPWQYYYSNFLLKNNWSKFELPFKNFKKSNLYQPKNLIGNKIKSIGIVAGFDNFYADIAVSEIGFY